MDIGEKYERFRSYTEEAIAGFREMGDDKTATTLEQHPAFVSKDGFEKWYKGLDPEEQEQVDDWFINITNQEHLAKVTEDTTNFLRHLK
ncbi:hypothetical protein CL614_03810 [archaeon]|nr:hypothetical protein [archaeon]